VLAPVLPIAEPVAGGSALTTCHRGPTERFARRMSKPRVPRQIYWLNPRSRNSVGLTSSAPSNRVCSSRNPLG